MTEEWAGSGHRMAAEALADALREIQPDTEVRIVMGLQTASPMLREVSRFFYLNILRYRPSLWQRLHERDHKWAAALKKPLGIWLSRRLITRLIEQERPDIVVATHAYCFAALAEAKRKASKPFSLVGIPTDYCFHHFWVHPGADLYAVAHPQLAEQIRVHAGLEHVPILEAGIPIRRKFQTFTDYEKGQWKQKLGLQPQLFTVLLCGGEGGYGAMEQVLRGLVAETDPLQIVVVTGRNRALRERLSRLVPELPNPTGHALVIRGYEPAIWEWMAAADLLITKPGGISCAEALALRTPLILYQPLPGQEQRNVSFLMQQQAALFAGQADQVGELVGRLRTSAEEREEIIRRMSQLGKPDASERIARYLLQL